MEIIKMALFHYATWCYVLILLIANTAEINESVHSTYKLARAHME